MVTTDARPWHPFRQPGLCGIRGAVGFVLGMAFLIAFSLLYFNKSMHNSDDTMTIDAMTSTVSPATFQMLKSNERKVVDEMESEMEFNSWYKLATYSVKQILGEEHPPCVYCQPLKDVPLIMPAPFNSTSCYDFNYHRIISGDIDKTRCVDSSHLVLFRNCPVCPTNSYHYQSSSAWYLKSNLGCAAVRPMLTGPIENEGTEDVLIDFVIVPGQKFECFEKSSDIVKTVFVGNFSEGKVKIGTCGHTWVVNPYCEAMQFRDVNGTLHPCYKYEGSVRVDSEGKHHTPPPSGPLVYPGRDIADVFWYCGGRIRSRLPEGWVGVCAKVMLVSKTLIKPLGNVTVDSGRQRRAAPVGSFDSGIYIDDIGVPRGVPTEFKARNQVAAGLESFFCVHCTVNKNVDWINYIYYNQQRFINYTVDAISGLSEQLAKTSEMAWQNRIALDMLLAEKGGVCVLFNNTCCTYIPNNTASDGSVTKALSSMRTLRLELSEHSGFDDSKGVWSWIDGSWEMFGKWKAVLLSVLCGIGVILLILLFLACCLFPCVRKIVEKTMAKSFAVQMMNYSPLEDSDWVPPFKDEEATVSDM
ncbi:uncharacterized protein LOC134017599 isoform X1 [Osmerus eperlanus]|uniref:uncharacterized protein LOC134017599 isoform X1 n=1 Tax=Osmerus eperlanus TaxID=29151 RepID=UPI002E1662BB